MITFEAVVTVLSLAMLELGRDRALLLQLGDRLAVGRVLVRVDHPRDPVPAALQGGRKEALGGLGVAPVGEEAVERRATFVDRAVEILPAPLDPLRFSPFAVLAERTRMESGTGDEAEAANRSPDEGRRQDKLLRRGGA